jgi:hypothetical protein
MLDYLKTSLESLGFNDTSEMEKIYNIVKDPKTKSNKISRLIPYLGEDTSTRFLDDMIAFSNHQGGGKRKMDGKKQNDVKSHGRERNGKNRKDVNNLDIVVTLQNSGEKNNRKEKNGNPRVKRNREFEFEKKENEPRKKPRYEEQADVKNIPPAKLDLSGTRCRYYPQCARADCPYFHPTEVCSVFPNCPNGENCLFVHPRVPCLYGSLCLRRGCSYTHPARHNAPCNKGFACPEKLTTCGFIHPALACRYGTSCNKGPTCVYSHNKPCNFGAECRKVNCPFAHIFEFNETGEPQHPAVETTNSSHVNAPHITARVNIDEALSESLPKSDDEENENAATNSNAQTTWEEEPTQTQSNKFLEVFDDGLELD